MHSISNGENIPFVLLSKLIQNHDENGDIGEWKVKRPLYPIARLPMSQAIKSGREWFNV